MGLTLITLLILAGFYLELVTNLVYNYNTIVPPVAPLGALFVLAALNPLLARRRRSLSRRELLTTYVLTTVGAPLMAHGTVMWFLSSPGIGWRYYARVAPHWEPAFFDLVPTWFSPTETVAVDGFFLGNTPVPWAAWAMPLAAWTGFFVALFLANLFLMLLLQRRWITEERLTFPIAQIPLETVAGGEAAARLPAAKMFWIGLAAAALLCLQDDLPSIWPALPRLPLWGLRVMEWRQVGPLAGLGDIWLTIMPWTIALAYLMPKDLSFSGWFFYVVRVLLCIIAIAAGATPRRPEEWRDTSFPAPEYQGGGAVIALGLLALWAGRHHLYCAVRSAVARRPATTEAEPTASPWVVLGLTLAVTYLVVFCACAGSRLVVAAALIGLIVFYHIVWGRLRAENGMSFIAFPLSVNDMLTRPLGTAAFRPAEMMMITATRWAYWPGWGETCEVVTGASLDGLKIAEAARIGQRRLAALMVGAFVFALGVSIAVALSGSYHYGFQNLYQRGGWLESSVQGGGARIYDALANPSGPSGSAFVALGSGVGLTFVLSAMRMRFWWWPLHPVGYLVANVWGSQWWWCPLFIGWVLKTLVVRYGGLRLYQKTVPMAIGAIVGNQLSDLIWPLLLWLARR